MICLLHEKLHLLNEVKNKNSCNAQTKKRGCIRLTHAQQTHSDSRAAPEKKINDCEMKKGNLRRNEYVFASFKSSSAFSEYPFTRIQTSTYSEHLANATLLENSTFFDDKVHSD